MEKTFKKYIEGQKLFELASTATPTPVHGTGAPSTPTGAPMRASPIRTPGRKKQAKIGDLPRDRDRIIAAIKANPGKKAHFLSGVLEQNYGLVVHMKALEKYGKDQNRWSTKPDAPTPSRAIAGKRPLGEATGHAQKLSLIHI